MSLQGDGPTATAGEGTGRFAIQVLAVVAAGFGLLTTLRGGTMLAGSDVMRSAAGDYVPFVVLFNFLAGFACFIVGIGLWRRRRWAVWLAVGIAAATAAVVAAFGVT